MSIRTRYELVNIQIDINQWKRKVAAYMEEEIRDAARDWIKNALSIIPVWSRASHATFKPLADAVGFVIPTGVLEARKDRSNLGESTSTGRLEITETTYHFVYETSLRYLAYNEFNNASLGENNIFAGLESGTPYQFTVTGAEQFKARRPTLPNPFDFQKVRKK